MLCGSPGRRHGNDGIGFYSGIVRYIGVGPAYGKFPFVVVADDFADGIFSTEHSFGEALAQVDDIGLLEVLYRISAQYFNAHGLEEQGIGANFLFVETDIAVVERP